MSIGSFIEKSPLQSKKFIAYLISNLGAKALLAGMILTGQADIVMLVTIVSASFIDVGYILGQAALDKYTRCAALASGQQPPG